MNSGIYKIENVINGHCYIGQSVDVNRREHDHFWRLEKNIHHNRYLQNAYKKYGKENLTFDVLLYCEPFELTRYEQCLVDCINPKYNIHRECVDTPKGVLRTNEYKQKMSQSLKGKKRSMEHKQNLALAAIGNKSCLGRKMSKETRQKIGLKNKGRNQTEETRYKRSLALKGNTNGLGYKHSEEAKQNMSLTRKGRKLSEEARHNMSMAAKKGWEKRRENKNVCKGY